MLKKCFSQKFCNKKYVQASVSQKHNMQKSTAHKNVKKKQQKNMGGKTNFIRNNINFVRQKYQYRSVKKIYFEQYRTDRIFIWV